MGLRFVIQSLKPPAYLEERVEAFTVAYRQELSTLSDEAFRAQKDGLCQKLRHAPQNLAEEASRYWYQIQQGYHDFTRGTQILSFHIEIIIQA